MPLILEASSWEDGVYKAATMGSETTAAIVGEVGIVRRDPMAMLPFCGYHIGDYFKHWLNIGSKSRNPPRIFNVNWFRKDANGKFAWPGFGHNMRVLKWIVERCQGRAEAAETSLGLVPRYEDLTWEGLNFTREQYSRVMWTDGVAWTKELASHDKLFETIGDKLPDAIRIQRKKMGERIGGMAE